MKDLMLDIETLGNTPNAVIVQIAAAYFDRETGEVGLVFNENINIESSMSEGFEVSPNTIRWWLNQPSEVINSVFSDIGEDIYSVLRHFMSFANQAETIWSHATFDFVIVNNALRRLGMKQLPYQVARDIRTLVDLTGFDYKDFPREGTHHNALDDVMHQIKYCVAAMRELRK